MRIFRVSYDRDQRGASRVDLDLSAVAVERAAVVPGMRCVAPAVALLTLGAAAAAQEPVVLAPSMVDVLAPRTNDIIGVLIDALEETGAIEPARLSAEEWTAIEAAIDDLHAETVAIRERPIQVAAPGQAIFGEDAGGLSAADVQALIDGDRAGFDFYTDVLLADIAGMESAAAARDATALWSIANGLDATCNACHQKFWYPAWDEGTPRPSP